MVELKIYLSESLNERFRRTAMSVYGYGRGSLSKAAEEAFTKWCTENEPSLIHENASARSEATKDHPSRETETHINPDERENMVQNAKSLREDNATSSTGSTA